MSIESVFFRLGGLLVDALWVTVFALTVRSFWKARARPTRALVAWTHAVFSGVALAVGSTVFLSGFGFRATYLAVFSIVILGWITAHNWPRTHPTRSSTAVGYATLALVVMMSLGVITVAVGGTSNIQRREARVKELSGISTADIARFAEERQMRPRGSEADPLAQWRIPESEWRLAEVDLGAVVAAPPGQELAVYQRARDAAQRGLVEARRDAAGVLWGMSIAVGLIVFTGVGCARIIEHTTHRALVLDRRDIRPALVCGLVTIAGFLIGIAVRIGIVRALLLALAAGLLTAAALIYRCLAYPPRR